MILSLSFAGSLLMVAITQSVDEVFSHGDHSGEIPSVCPVPHFQLKFAAIFATIFGFGFDRFDHINVAIANHKPPILFVVCFGGSNYGHHLLSTGVDTFFVAMLAKAHNLRRGLWVRLVLILVIERKRNTNYSYFFLDQVDFSDCVNALLLVNDLRVGGERLIFFVRLLKFSICKVIKLETFGLCRGLPDATARVFMLCEFLFVRKDGL